MGVRYHVGVVDAISLSSAVGRILGRAPSNGVVQPVRGSKNALFITVVHGTHRALRVPLRAGIKRGARANGLPRGSTLVAAKGHLIRTPGGVNAVA